MRSRVCNSQSFGYSCCHGRMSSSSSLPTSVCTKKEKKLLSSSVELKVEHCTLTNVCMPRAGPTWNASQKDRASGVSEHARVQGWVPRPHALKGEWLCVIDDTFENLPWQTSKYGVALIPKFIGNRKKIVREVAGGGKPYLTKSTDHKAEIRKAFFEVSGLICAFRSADFLRSGLSPRATSRAISFSISNSFWY